MGRARDELLGRVMAVVAREGLGGRSLRDVAADAGTSHRMLLYHFESRAGLVAAMVDRMEADQVVLLRELAAEAESPQQLIRRQWTELTRPEVLPFVRLFLETVALTSRGPVDDLTGPWIDATRELAAQWGLEFDPPATRLGVAVIRGLLVDVLGGGSVTDATEALERHLATLLPAPAQRSGTNR
jgi:AcrR family transcriptional regulator